jgi:8-oxo-dGTP diphosphatase
MFNPALSRVALIKKNHPPWQAGKLNGIGGKIDGEETAEQAMVREFKEETGTRTLEKDWRQFCVMNCTGTNIYCFTAVGDIYKLRNVTAEHIEIRNVEIMGCYNVIPNLRWLIPMALDHAVSAYVWI